MRAKPHRALAASLLLLAARVDAERLRLELLTEGCGHTVVPFWVLAGLVAVAGHRRRDVGEPDPPGADGEVQVRGPRRVLPEPGCIGRAGKLVRLVISVAVADAADVLGPEQPAERVRRVLLRAIVGVMKAVPVAR